jgi:hypothetical protein
MMRSTIVGADMGFYDQRVELSLCISTLSRAWCALFESRSGKLKIQLKLCRR